MLTVSDDLLSDEVIRNPYPTLRAMREAAPVHWNERWKGWVVTDFQTINSAHKNPALSNDKYAPFKAMKTPTPDQEAVFSWLGLWLGSQDAPLHTRLRTAIQGAFTSRSSIDAMEPFIRKKTDELLSRAAGRGEMDLITDLAYPLTSAVIANLLGMPQGDLDRVQRWADAVAPIMFMTPGVRDRYAIARAELEDMAAYFGGLLSQRDNDPKDDLISALAKAKAQGTLSEREVIATCMVVIFGGHETTKDLLGNGMLALLEHPEQLARLRAEPALIESAVEELLRFDSPAKSTVRWATEDTVLGGQAIEAGQRILMFWSGANRDPAQFDRPDTLDISRCPNHHLGFGKGIHYCIGAPLGRREAVVAISMLLERFSEIRLAVPAAALEWRPTIIMRSLVSLPVHLEAA